MVIYRPVRPDETGDVEALDNSFTTDAVIEVTAADDGFVLRTVPVDPPLRKVFPDDEDEDDRDGSCETHVAEDGDGLCGAVTFVHEAWNRRLLVADLRVSPAHRGRGIGTGLMERALARGAELGARTAWLEVSSVNVPAVRAYRRMGFALCGLDASLYVGTSSEGETALFMSRAVAPSGPLNRAR